MYKYVIILSGLLLTVATSPCSAAESEDIAAIRASAESGNATDQLILGMHYGAGTADNFTEAAKWYRKSAEQGNRAAQFALGSMYAKGKGVPKDVAEAVKWYQLSANQGYRVAQTELAIAYRSGDGVPVDLVQAYAWFKIAADNGSKESKEFITTVEKEITSEQKIQALKLAQELSARLQKK